jgi:hypothetical protein
MNRPSTPSRRLVFILLLLVIYVASFGPIKALYANHRLEGSMPTALVTFYQPVDWLHEHTPLGKPMLAYDEWWKRMLKQS